jgi:DNA repair exonuclease SbcCD nuclease subunit
MSEPAFVATSDMHVDEHAWADRPEIRGDSQAAFAQVCGFAIKHRKPVIAAGDLLDRKRNDALPIGFIRRQMDELQEKNIPFYYIQGQHELQADPWLSEVHRWPTWLHRTSATIGGLRVYGIDWTSREALPEMLKEVPSDTDVLVLHQVCHEFMGGITVAEMNLTQVPYAQLVVVGDFHEHKILRLNGFHGQGMRVLSPGSTNMRKIDEPPLKRFFVVHEDLSVKSVRIVTRPFAKQEILSEDMLAEFVTRIRGELKDLTEESKLRNGLDKPLLRVSYRSDLENAYSRIAAAVGDWAHLFTKVIQPPRETDGDNSGEETYEEVADLGLVGCLPLLVDEAEEPDVYNLCHLLLSTDSPAAALASARAEYFASGEKES